MICVADMGGLEWRKAMRAVPYFKRFAKVMDDNFPEKLHVVRPAVCADTRPPNSAVRRTPCATRAARRRRTLAAGIRRQRASHLLDGVPAARALPCRRHQGQGARLRQGRRPLTRQGWAARAHGARTGATLPRWHVTLVHHPRAGNGGGAQGGGAQLSVGVRTGRDRRLLLLRQRRHKLVCVCRFREGRCADWFKRDTKV
eukprot:7376143-Prymnesium_polylepis.1